MRILIDEQYKYIYNGEFLNWTNTCIIRPLLENNEIDFSSSVEESKNLLAINNYDLVFITGYDSTLLSFIDDKKYPTKVACIIYDMNAEKMLAYVDDNGNISDIISFKSRLIFLSTYVICHNKQVHEEIVELYEIYKDTVDVTSKLVDVDYNIDFSAHKHKRIYKEKYMLIKESINGVTFLTNDFFMFIDTILKTPNLPDNFIFVIICNKFPKNIWNKIKFSDKSDKFKIITDISENELKDLQAGASITMFISPLDNDLDFLSSSILSNSICIINVNNDTFNKFLNDSCISIPLDGNYNFCNDIYDILRSSADDRKNIKNMQLSKLQYLCYNAKPFKI